MTLPTSIIEKHKQSFSWGERDCVQFAADMVEYQTGVRPKLPEYSTEREAAKILRNKNLAESVAEALGEAVEPKDAEWGDVVLTAFREPGQMLGVADPPVFWLKAPIGLVPVEMNLAVSVFRCR